MPETLKAFHRMGPVGPQRGFDARCRRASLLHGDQEWRVGASRRYHSSDAEEFGFPELAHSVERFDRDGSLGRTSSVVA